MVGIVGGVLNSAKPDDHLRLGDVVVSGQSGVVRYDFNKEEYDCATEQPIIKYRYPPRAPSVLLMPRVNLLIADDVGLGKTIEAGLVLQEMLSRQRIRRAMIVCPASLQRQWQEEMVAKFQLPFEIIDRDAIQRLRREYGSHVNPWNTFPRLITSMDFLKQEQMLALFRNSLQNADGCSPLRDWDMLIVDEAHNVAPSGRKTYSATAIARV